MSLADLFGATVQASFVYAPLALGLAAVSAVLLIAIGWVSSALPGFVATGIWLFWLAFSHALFITFLCGFIGLRALPTRRRAAAAIRAALPASLPITALLGLGGAASLVIPISLPLLWLPACYFAVPARLIDTANGTAGRPIAVPPAHRLALVAPGFLFLVGLSWLLRGGDWGMMDGGAVLFPLLGLALFIGCYTAAIFSCYFAWPATSHSEAERKADAG